MALSIGHLVGYLELDDKRFNRSAAAADKKMTALQLHLKALEKTNPKIRVDVETRKLDELKARLADLKAQAAKGVDVRVEIAQALIEIDRVQMKLRELHNREVKIDVDNRSALASIGAVGSKISGLWATILVLGPMLLPVAGAATGGILAIGSASVSAAAGVGILALALGGIGESTKALAKYREAVDAAGPKAKIESEQLAVGVRAAQKAYAKHPTALNAQKLAIAKQKQAMGPQSLLSAKHTLDQSKFADQTAAGKSFVRFTLDKLQPAGHQLRASAQSAVLPGVERGLESLLKRLPLFDRLVTHVGEAVGKMAARAGKALTDPFWRQFFNWIAATAGPNLLTMGHTFGRVFEGIARTLMRFGPQGHSLLLWVDSLATKFNKWSQGGVGSGFQRFMDYVEQSGPAVLEVLRPLGVIIPQLLAGMSSTGMGELHVFGAILAGIATLPTGAIQVIGATLPVIVLALKGMQIVNGLVTGVKLFGDAMGGLAGQTVAAEKGLSRWKQTAQGLGLIGGSTLLMSGVHDKGKGGYIKSALGGALIGGSLGSVIPGVGTAVGAGIGAAGGALTQLITQLNSTNRATKRSAGSWKDYASTLDGVTEHATRATRALAYQRLEASGMLDSTRKLGLSDRTVVQAVTGNPKARKELATALSDEKRFHGHGLSADEIKSIENETAAVGKARLAQLQMNLATAQGKKQIDKAQKALDDFAKTNGTAKVGLTGYQETMRQLRSIKRALMQVWGKTPDAPTSGPGGLDTLLNPTITPTHKAHGGKVRPGHLYNVAEGGRFELFVPNVAGQIVSNHNAKQMLSAAGGGVTLEQLADLVKGMQPLYGDVHISGDPTVFRREMQADARRASLAGGR